MLLGLNKPEVKPLAYLGPNALVAAPIRLTCSQAVLFQPYTACRVPKIRIAASPPDTASGARSSSGTLHVTDWQRRSVGWVVVHL